MIVSSLKITWGMSIDDMRRIYRFLQRLRHRLAPKSESWFLGMTSWEEQKYFSKCAERLASMDGDIVDLGCWLGSTTLSMDRGIRRAANKSPSSKMYAFDRFVWEPYMEMDGVRGIYSVGEDFQSAAEQRILDGTNREYIELVKADLTNYQWDQNREIKLLLADAMKGRRRVTNIARTFYPCLRMGAIVIQQDFKHYNSSFMHVLHYRLGEYFDFIDDSDVSDGGTVAFKVREKIGAETLISATDFSDLDAEEIDRVFAKSVSYCGNEEGRMAIKMAHVLCYFQMGDVDTATRLFGEIVESGRVRRTTDVLAMERLLTTGHW